MCVQIGEIGGEHRFVTEIPNDFQDVPGLLPLYAFKNVCITLLALSMNGIILLMP